MTAPFLEKIDWSRPWLAHVKAAGQAISAVPDWRNELNRRAIEMGLHNHRGLPIQFVLQAALPAGVAYESHISHTGCVPTRENLHDFFNALVWLTFPDIKRQLNALQAHELEKRNLSPIPHRGRLRDAATIFDENAILLVSGNRALIDALRGHHWIEAFMQRREKFADGHLFLFGHALMEKLVTPYKAITGHMWILTESSSDMPPDFALREIDERIAGQLAAGLTTRDFSPLPVLGVPGWWSGQDEAFYLDANVFRSKRE